MATSEGKNNKDTFACHVTDSILNFLGVVFDLVLTVAILQMRKLRYKWDYMPGITQLMISGARIQT